MSKEAREFMVRARIRWYLNKLPLAERVRRRITKITDRTAKSIPGWFRKTGLVRFYVKPGKPNLVWFLLDLVLYCESAKDTLVNTLIIVINYHS